MGRITSGLKGVGAGFGSIIIGFLALSQAYQTDWKGDIYFYPFYYYFGWVLLIFGGLGILGGIIYILAGLVPKKETTVEIKDEHKDS